jgi:hypothetical protein
MIVLSQATYEEFKAAFDTLGGGHKTLVCYSSSTSFQVMADLDNVILALSLGSEPGSFTTDFPNAILGISVGIGG